MSKVEKQYVEHGSFKGFIDVAVVDFNDEYTKQIEGIIEKNPRNFVKVLKSKGFKGRYVDRSYLYDYVLEVTPLLDDPIYTFKTRLYWALHKMTSFPWCLNETHGAHQMIGINIKKMKDGYQQHCNRKCQHEDPKYYEGISDAIERKYGKGIRNAYQIPSVKEGLAERKEGIQAKRDATRELHFPGDKGWNLKKSLETRHKLYGGPVNLEATYATKERIHGDKNWNNTEKAQATKRSNGTFNTSKPEDEVYELLRLKFGKEDIKRQYKSEAYPFNCDFYIKSLNLYFECNFSWVHGYHWFDPNNEADIALVEKWKSKNSKFYDNAIDTWTVRDIKKLIIAQMNGINFKVAWTLSEAEVLIESLSQPKLGNQLFIRKISL